MKTQEVATVIVAGVTLAAAVWLVHGGYEAIVERFGRNATIHVWSIKRPDSRDLFAGERLRVDLVNVPSSRVFWLFDETEVRTGGVAIEYVFANRKGGAVPEQHRIDAFYRDGNSYKSASLFPLRIEPLDLSVRFQLDSGRLAILLRDSLVSTPRRNSWNLAGVGLREYRANRFVRTVDLAPQPSPPAGWTAWFGGLDSVESFVALRHRDNWAEVKYSRPGGDTLGILVHVDSAELALLPRAN
jgi:hypothetical protein